MHPASPHLSQLTCTLKNSLPHSVQTRALAKTFRDDGLNDCDVASAAPTEAFGYKSLCGAWRSEVHEGPNASTLYRTEIAVCAGAEALTPFEEWVLWLCVCLLLLSVLHVLGVVATAWVIHRRELRGSSTAGACAAPYLAPSRSPWPHLHSATHSLVQMQCAPS